MKSNKLKLIVNVPKSHIDQVRLALGEAGAGKIGAYTNCAFTVLGKGYFLGDASSNPKVGQRGNLEEVAEYQLQMVLDKKDLKSVYQALKLSHPYEEIPLELFELLSYEDLI